MTNYNERLDKILSQLMKDAIANRRADDPPQGRKMLLGDAKQAVTSLIKELVAEAKPEDYPVCENSPNQSVSRWCNKNKCWTCRERDNYELWGGIGIGIEKFEQNLLKALEEV